MNDIDFLREHWMNAILLVAFVMLLVLIFAKFSLEPIAQDLFDRGYKLGRSECNKVEYNKGQFAYMLPTIRNLSIGNTSIS